MRRKALSFLLLFFVGCAGKVVKDMPRLTVYITKGTVITDERRDHIVAVARNLCRKTGRPDAEKIILDNKDRGIVTLAAYLCVDECSGIDDPEDCTPGQRYVLEEVVQQGKEENHYITFRSLIESAQ